MSDLQYRLEKFFNDEVVVRKREMKVAKNMVQTVVKIIEKELRSEEVKRRLGLEIGPPIFTGSVWEGLKEGLADEFDIMFPITLDGTAWRIEPLNNVDPGYIPYKCKCYLESPGRNAYTYRDIISRYGSTGPSIELSPEKITKRIKEEINNALEKNSSPSGKYNYSFPKDSSGPSIVMHLNYSANRIPSRQQLDEPSEYEAYVKYSKPSAVSVDLVPCLVLKSGDSEVFLVGKGKEGRYENIWRRSFSVDEKRIFREISRNGKCYKKVLRILKAIHRGNNSYAIAFTRLRSYIFKTAVLNISDRGDWSQENLAERFKSVLCYLEICLRDRHMPCYFEPKQNLLAKANEADLSYICSKIAEINKYKYYSALL